jgi:dihydroorotate dehydrogenase electron transfer subunit
MMPAEFAPRVAEERCKVVSHQTVNAEYRHLVVSGSHLAASAAPGQFYQLLCPTTEQDEPFLRRPMSVYGAAPEIGEISFLYKVTGAGTRGLATLQPGETLRVMGPLGHGFTLKPAWKHIVAIGRGAGLATLGPLAKAAKAAGIGVTAILSARSPELMLSVALFRAHGAQVIEVADSDGSSDPAHIDAILRGLIAQGRCDAFFTCGSQRLLRLQQKLAVEFNLPGEVAMEQQMACGLGMCFCCVCDVRQGDQIIHKRVCWDGPVFSFAEAIA